MTAVGQPFSADTYAARSIRSPPRASGAPSALSRPPKGDFPSRVSFAVGVHRETPATRPESRYIPRRQRRAVDGRRAGGPACVAVVGADGTSMPCDGGGSRPILRFHRFRSSPVDRLSGGRAAGGRRAGLRWVDLSAPPRGRSVGRVASARARWPPHASIARVISDIRWRVGATVQLHRTQPPRRITYALHTHHIHITSVQRARAMCRRALCVCDVYVMRM